jgi:predicted nucleic-acid-binding Zn-ribbon protein
MQESMKCPRCGGQLEKGNLGYSGRTAFPITILKKGDFIGDKIIPFYCKNCGHIELFNEKILDKSITTKR